MNMDKCSICLEGINNPSRTNCNHHFCSDCLNDWLSQNKNTCPICRTKLESFITNDITTKIISINSNSRNIDPSNTIVDIVDMWIMMSMWWTLRILWTWLIWEIL